MWCESYSWYVFRSGNLLPFWQLICCGCGMYKWELFWTNRYSIWNSGGSAPVFSAWTLWGRWPTFWDSLKCQCRQSWVYDICYIMVILIMVISYQLYHIYIIFIMVLPIVLLLPQIPKGHDPTEGRHIGVMDIFFGQTLEFWASFPAPCHQRRNWLHGPYWLNPTVSRFNFGRNMWSFCGNFSAPG